jgi:hypothetical protein
MKTMRLIPLLAAASLLWTGCDDGPSPEAKANAQIREQIQQTISELEAKSRTKASSLGMATAQTATITEVKSFVCSALIKTLKTKKTSTERSAVADDLTEYECRKHEDWLVVLKKTAKQQGMERADTAAIDEARSFVCKRIRSSIEAVRDKDKDALILEAKLYDCYM